MLDQLQNIDRHITLAINQCYSAWSDPIWIVFSGKKIWYILYLAVAIALIVRLGWKKGLTAIVSIVLVIVACDQGGNFVKDTVQRYRPVWDAWMTGHGLHILEGRYDFYGFYSAHAANSMGFAVCSSRCFRWNGKGRYNKAYTIVIVLWAVLVGLSRIFVGRHFFGDVVVGFAVGIGFSFLFSYLGKKVAQLLK